MFSVSYQFRSSWCERHGAPEFFQTEASSWEWGPRARRFPDWPSWRKCRSRDRPTWEASGPGSSAAEARRRWRPSWRARRPTKPPGPGGGGSRPARAKAAAERSRDSNPRAWDQQPCRSDAPIRWFAFVREIREIRNGVPPTTTSQWRISLRLFCFSNFAAFAKTDRGRADVGKEQPTVKQWNICSKSSSAAAAVDGFREKYAQGFFRCSVGGSQPKTQRGAPIGKTSPPPPGRETPSAPKQGDSVPKLLQLLGTTVTLLSLSLPVRAKMSLCFSNNSAFEGRSIALLVQRELVTLKNES